MGTKRIHRKIFIRSSLILAFIGLISIVITTYLERRQLYRESEQSNIRLARAVMTGIGGAMLKNERADISKLVQQSGTQPGMRRVFLVNREGVVNYTSDTSMLKSRQGLDEPGCMECHRSTGSISFSKVLRFRGERVQRSVVPIENGAECQACHDAKQQRLGMLIVDSRTDQLEATMNTSYVWIFFLSLLTFGVLEAVLVLNLKGLIADPISTMVGGLDRIKEGKLWYRIGDGVRNDDEIGVLSKTIDSMTTGLEEIVKEIHGASQGVSQSSSGISQACAGMQVSFENENAGVGAVSGSVGQIDSSIVDARQKMADIAAQSDSTSAAISEIRANIAGLGELSRSLSSEITGTNKMIQSMTQSQRQLNEAIDGIYAAIEEATSSTIEMTTSIREIRNHATESERLAINSQEDALHGSEAVAKAVICMEELQKEIDETASLIVRLGQRSESVGAILGVINDLTERTNLLALNAAIIASEAGQHGRRFQVVADEMRALSQKTANSAREIGELIKAVQRESVQAASRMGHLKSNADREVQLSRESLTVLEQILCGVNNTLESSRFIARTTDEQTSGMAALASSSEKIKSTAALIKQSARVQEAGARKIGEATGKVLDFTATFERAMSEQTQATRQVETATTNINRMIHAALDLLDGQVRESTSIIQALEKLRENSNKNVVRVSELAEIVRDLDQVSNSLHDKIRRFETHSN